VRSAALRRLAPLRGIIPGVRQTMTLRTQADEPGVIRLGPTDARGDLDRSAWQSVASGGSRSHRLVAPSNPPLWPPPPRTYRPPRGYAADERCCHPDVDGDPRFVPGPPVCTASLAVHGDRVHDSGARPIGPPDEGCARPSRHRHLHLSARYHSHPSQLLGRDATLPLVCPRVLRSERSVPVVVTGEPLQPVCFSGRCSRSGPPARVW
jgi:hypothetical protein